MTPVVFRDLFVTHAGNEVRLSCPRCGPAWQLQRVADWQMSGCAACNGTFVGFAQLEELMQSHDRPGDIQSFALQNPLELGRTLPCAACQMPMQPSLFFHQIVDVCHLHGVWFDPSELTAAMERMGRLLGLMAVMAAEPAEAPFVQTTKAIAPEPLAVLRSLVQAGSSAPTGQRAECPSCEAALNPAVVWLRCITCHGIFIDFNRLQQLAAALDLGDVRIQVTLLAVAPAQRRQLRPCPHCRLVMQQHQFFRQAVDVCVTHGVWFDVHELENATAKMQQLLLQMQIRRLMQRDGTRRPEA